MKIVFIGTVEFSYKCLECVIKENGNVIGIATLKSSKVNADFKDLTPVAKSHNIPINYFKNINEDDMVNRSDIHSDHRVIAEAVFSSTKVFRYPFIKKLLMYECISETEMAPQLIENIFLPNVFSDITIYMEEKLKMMSIYKSEIQVTPLPRSLENIRALAKFRGSSSAVDYAEAFMLIRERF